MLTQARERFYPVDAYLIDLCLLDPAMPAGVLADPLERPVAISFIVPAQAIENQALHDPAARGRAAAGDHRRLGRRRRRHVLRGGRPALAAGVDPLAVPPRGRGLSAHLDDRNVETFARRRFGLYPQLPQIAKRFGFRFALHMGFDAGRFPIRAETKRLWESPDGSSLESLLRPPLAADRAVAGLAACPGGWPRR